MSASRPADWRSLHVFHPRLDDLLVRGVRPALAAWRREGAITGWFYLRFWNGGPHLRVRLRASRAAEADAALAVHATLERWLGDHPADPPSARRYAETVARMESLRQRLQRYGLPPPVGVEEPETLQPTGSVQVRPWVYETARFGGAEAQPHVVAHYVASSALALRVVAGTAGRAAARHTLALHMAALVARVLGAATPATAALFEQAAAWTSLLDGEPPADVGADREAAGDELRLLLGEGLPLPGQPAAVNDLLRAWQDELAGLVHSLRGLQAAGRLAGQADHVVMECLHLANNRLGIGLAGENVLYQLVAGGLRQAGAADDAVRAMETS